MNRSMKYLTPKMPITEIERQRAEEAEEQNIDLYEAIAGLFEEVVGLTEKVSSSKVRSSRLKEDKQNESERVHDFRLCRSGEEQQAQC